MTHPLLQPETIALVRALKTHLREQKIELREFVVEHEGSSLRGAVVEGVRVNNRYDDRPKLDTNISDNQRRVLEVLAEA